MKRSHLTLSLFLSSCVAVSVPACSDSVDNPVDSTDLDSGGSKDAGISSDTSSGGEASVKDGGSPDSLVDLCGNGSLDPGETCDDGNQTADDGCSASCAIESGYKCTGTGAISCRQICGNAVTQSLEACDFGNPDAGDAASTSPACTSTCSLVEGFTCTSGTCTATCGDGKVNGTETCDEGPLNGEPTHCNGTCSATIAASCGDGRVQAGEGCDDGAQNGQANKCALGCPVPNLLLPAHSSPFTGNVRGYWFTAPKDFVITSLRVPTEASSGNQSIAVVRLPAAPPLYSTTTNTFDLLYLVQDSAITTAFPVKIPVSKDEIIGVLGQRGTVNSYATSPYASSIDGLPMNLQRMGMQFSLTTTAPRDLWTENGGSISRVDFTYAASQCGDGVKVISEGCDDGNLVAGDGCSATCTEEVGFSCSEGSVGITASTCSASCGDGTKASTEGCDDGAANGTAGMCDTGCRGKELAIGTESATPGGRSLGFWFTAPSALVIRGLRVPTTAGADNQAVQIVKFLAAPPTNGSITNNFQSLAYVKDVAGTNFIDVNVKVASGDRIGILGSRGTGASAVSSVASAPITSSMVGAAVTLNPLRSEGSLGAATAFDLTAGSAGATGRVEVLVGN